MQSLIRLDVTSETVGEIEISVFKEFLSVNLFFFQ